MIVKEPITVKGSDGGEGIEDSLGESPSTISNTAFGKVVIRWGAILFFEQEQEKSYQRSFGGN